MTHILSFTLFIWNLKKCQICIYSSYSNSGIISIKHRKAWLLMSGIANPLCCHNELGDLLKIISGNQVGFRTGNRSRLWKEGTRSQSARRLMDFRAIHMWKSVNAPWSVWNQKDREEWAGRQTEDGQPMPCSGSSSSIPFWYPETVFI